MSLYRGNLLPSALGRLFALLVAAPAVAQTAPPSPQQVRILVKEAMPDLGTIQVRWSDDGRYVAIAPPYAGKGVPWEAVVYDTNFGAEIRRLYGTADGTPSHDLPLSRTVAFAHHSPHIFIQSGSGILSCALETQDSCDTVLTGPLTNLALSQDDHIATIRYENNNPTLVYFDPLNPATAKSYQLHLPVANNAIGGFFSLAFFPESGAPEKIGFSAGTAYENLDHNTKMPDDESFISIVDLKACDGSPASHCTAEFQFQDLPFEFGAFAFTTSGKPLLCAQKSTRKPLQKLGSTLISGTIYDPVARQELTDKSFGANLPPVFNGCLNKRDPSIITAGLNLDRKQTRIMNTLYSPRGNVMLFTRRTESNELELYTQQLPKEGPLPPPVLLASASGALYSVAVYPNKLILATQGDTARYWNLMTGDVTSEPFSAVVNLNGDSTNFLYDSTTKNYTLWTAHNGQSGAATQVAEASYPTWLGISADGNTVAYSSALPDLGPDPRFVVNNLSKSAPNCYNFMDSHDVGPATLPGYVRQRYIFSPVAATFFVFCDHAGPDDKGVTHLYGWDLPSLKNSLDIVAGDNRNWIAPSLDGKTLVFGGFTSARLLNLATGTVRDLDVGIHPQQWIAFSDHIIGAELLNDNKTLVLAIVQADGTGAIKLLDVVTGASQQFAATDSPINSIATDRNNHIVIASADNLISIFDKSGKRLLRLAAIGFYDWLAFSDSGRFDGTPAALKALAYQSARDTPAITANQLFNELYTPGLLVYAWNGANLDLTPGISMTTYLELPGTRSILQTWKPYNDNGHAAICTSRSEFFTQIPSSPGRVHPTALTDPACQFGMTLTDQSNPAALLNGLNLLKSGRFPTPWDGQRAATRAKTLHIFRVAISHYTGNGMPSLPSSVPSTARLRDLLAAHPNSSTVKLWGKDNCGADLEDAAATRKNVLACFDAMINSVEPGDEVVLIFSGHGGTSLGGASESELFYFFPADYNPATANGIDAESYVITAPEIADRLRRLRAGRVAIILDACDSGTLVTPLELAAGARVTVHEVTNYFAGKPAADGESQGVLLLADAALHQDASSGMTTNLFLDKLSDTLSAHPTGLWSTDLLKIMKEPISVPAQFGGGYMNPSVLLIGTDFPISSPQ
jgi:hypothetical protein